MSKFKYTIEKLIENFFHLDLRLLFVAFEEVVCEWKWEPLIDLFVIMSHDSCLFHGTKFLLRLIESERKTKSDYVPIYLHTRILEIVDGYLKCSCRYNERFGLICRHMFYLLELLGVEPSHHDVDIRWWITFAMFAHTTE